MSHAFDDEMETPPLDREAVEARVEDWLARLEALFRTLETWASGHGLQIQRSQQPMLEELMTRYGAAAVQVPVLHIQREGAFVAKIVPYGLWVIGANGRVDLSTRRGVFPIVDMAQPLGSPSWRLAGPGYRDAPKLGEDVFIEALLA